jgi:hypothetical protein
MVLPPDACLFSRKWACLRDVRGQEDGEESEERSWYLRESHGVSGM